MTLKFFAAAVALFLMGSISSVDAATVSLVAASPVDGVQASDLVTFDIVMDFSDRATIGGGFDIVFDSAVLQFQSLFRDPAIGDPGFSRDPDIFDGLLESWTVSSFDPLPAVATLGNVVFSVLPGNENTSTLVSTQATSGIGGPWVDGVNFLDLIPVDYNSVEVSIIPEPALAALLALGLVGLARRTRSHLAGRHGACLEG